jgi:Sensors of blue-light using FAD
MLVHCLYASRSASAMSKPLLDAILEASRSHNPAHGITGILCVSGDVFIQVLEGGRDEVCDLYNTIVRDPRHTNVRILVYEEIRQRKFGGWTMGQVDLSKVNPSLMLKYHARSELNPFTSSGHATMALLDELVATAAIMSRTS